MTPFLNAVRACWLVSILGLGLLLAGGPGRAQVPPATSLFTPAARGSFPLVGQQAATLSFDPQDAAVVRVAVEALQHDIGQVTGKRPAIQPDATQLRGPVVLVGTLGKSAVVDKLVASGKLQVRHIRGQWETFAIGVVKKPLPGIPQALVIVGSDRRGTAFGVFELTRMMGVSPWTWWADVTPRHQDALYVRPDLLVEGPPSVQYRGIFLNDEDWGLRPWAARNMDPEVKDIGPKTYTRIFELLLRLKANFLWPAMHPGTKAFYYYPNNPRIADQYGIVVGSSHCEPMLRNNVFEWAENYEHEYGRPPGEWRYDLNGPQIATYWADRVQQSAAYESVYTVGMRGIHDGSMPGPKDRAAKVKLLDTAITDQRSLLAQYLPPAGRPVPQLFCPYKEVLSLYQSGLPLPEDVTIVWADDNHGYIRQLSSPAEQKRSGGSGVYYHLSYWGAPQDYLWLASISPTLVSYELTKAYQLGASRLWVINVGDIKPAELETGFAMDLAWNVGRWTPETAHTYPAYWAAETFGPALALPIARIKQEYYRLAQAGKPEHMDGLSFTDAEAEQRLRDYRAIADAAEALRPQLPAALQDAYFQLVLYPTQSARLMNEKFLLARQSLRLAARGDARALVCAGQAQAAFQQIQALTTQYNETIAGGKWAGMMSWHPRDQAVFQMPPVATSALLAAGRRAPATGPAQPDSLPVILAAAAYSAQKSAPNETLTVVPGLGLGGRSLTRFPYQGPSFSLTTLAAAPYAEYTAHLPAGSHRLAVQCLPTYPLYAGRGLRYAVSVNGDAPQVVDLQTPSDTPPWRVNVLRGYTEGQTTHQVATTGNATIRLYLLDPGLVIDQLKIQ